MEGADEEDEGDVGDSDDDDGKIGAEVPIEAEPGTVSSQESSKGPKEKKQKVPNDTRNYKANPKEHFISVDSCHLRDIS